MALCPIPKLINSPSQVLGTEKANYRSAASPSVSRIPLNTGRSRCGIRIRLVGASAGDPMFAPKEFGCVRKSRRHVHDYQL